jgi:hypothetical protein
VRGPPLRLGDREIDRAPARLRHQPAGRDGRRRGEYLSLVTGFRALLLVIAACYIGAVIARRKDESLIPNQESLIL